MNNQNTIRGSFLIATAICFGVAASRYPIGSLSRAGAGLFPILVSSLLFLLAVCMLIRTRLSAAEPFHFEWKNISIVLLGLASFVVAAKLINIVVAIVLLVFISSLAAASRSLRRSVLVSAALVAVAAAFQKLLGLNLRVF